MLLSNISRVCDTFCLGEEPSFDGDRFLNLISTKELHIERITDLAPELLPILRGMHIRADRSLWSSEVQPSLFFHIKFRHTRPLESGCNLRGSGERSDSFAKCAPSRWLQRSDSNDH